MVELLDDTYPGVDSNESFKLPDGETYPGVEGNELYKLPDGDPCPELEANERRENPPTKQKIFHLITGLHVYKILT